MKIVLIGFACCYKTSVGKLLAKKLNYAHIDTDKKVEDVAGKSIGEIFADDGEAEFRRLEREALLSFTECDDIVISCGGGAALCDDFRLLAKCATVVWLTANAATVAARLGDEVRPLFDGKTIEEIDSIIKTRDPFYKRYADLLLGTDGLTSEQVADILYRKLN